MGFLDKAKKLADQAQAKLDEAQDQFNPSQKPSGAAGAAVEYDQHGRPIARPETEPGGATPPHGDPVAAAPEHAPLADATGPTPEPPAPPAARDDSGHSPPPLSQGDPLAG
jgi:hypothetical protein